jgi:hypothetical protein
MLVLILQYKNSINLQAKHFEKKTTEMGTFITRIRLSPLHVYQEETRRVVEG